MSTLSTRIIGRRFAPSRAAPPLHDPLLLTITACRNGDIVPWFQARRRCSDDSVESLEALARWKVRTGWANTQDFTAAIARTVHTLEFDLTMLARAWLASNEVVGAPHGPDRVAVNMSPTSLVSARFVDVIVELLDAIECPPHRLEIEVTEVSADGPSADVIGGLRQRGIRIAIDDFGTGASSLYRLLTCPADVVKLDRSLLVSPSPRAVQLLRGVIGVIQQNGMLVVAEGVETQSDLDLVHELGCDTYQGWFGGVPAPTFGLEQFGADADADQLA